ncbi:hypothetical protein [Micromonospora sp. KC207]|uniref:hypothetical protein n=1 Tax=Micromonospora sp. KC207 TaxID=2530377 RepID=UPI0014046468|nr:hypothetical protein [Micromonospora sp. KC207]
MAVGASRDGAGSAFSYRGRGVEQLPGVLVALLDMSHEHRQQRLPDANAVG